MNDHCHHHHHDRHHSHGQTVNIDDNIRARSTVDLPVSSNWRKNNLTRELMREDLQIEIEALKVSLFESIKLLLCFWRLSSGINSFWELIQEVKLWRWKGNIQIWFSSGAVLFWPSRSLPIFLISIRHPNLCAKYTEQKSLSLRTPACPSLCQLVIKGCWVGGTWRSLQCLRLATKHPNLLAADDELTAKHLDSRWRKTLKKCGNPLIVLLTMPQASRKTSTFPYHLGCWGKFFLDWEKSFWLRGIDHKIFHVFFSFSFLAQCRPPPGSWSIQTSLTQLASKHLTILEESQFYF